MNFFLAGEMTTLNDFIAATNRNRYYGASIKKVETQRVMVACREIPPITCYPIRLHLIWYRVNQKSDPDNIAFSVKFLLDGMQEAGILKQDSWKHVQSIYHEFRLDKDNPGVEVIIE